MKESSNYGETIRDKLTLSPIEKYIKYDRYPYKMVLSIFLVILTTLATFNLLNIYSLSGQAQIKVFKQIMNFSETPNGENDFLCIPDFQNHLLTVISNLQNMKEFLFQKVDDDDTTYTIEVVPFYPLADAKLMDRQHRNSSNNTKNNISVIDINENYHDNSFYNHSFFSENYSYTINISEGIVRPFDLNSVNSIKSFLQRIKSFSLNVLNLKLDMSTPKKTVDYHTCWNIRMEYKNHKAASVRAKPTSSFFPCENTKEADYDGDGEDDSDEPVTAQIFPNNISQKRLPKFLKNKNVLNLNQLEYSEKFMGDSIITLHLLIFILAAASLILNLKYIYEMMHVYLQTLIKSKRKIIMTDSINPAEYPNEKDVVLFKNQPPRKSMKTLDKLLDADKPWHLLSFREKMLFFDFWFLLGIVSNMVQMWASILVLSQEISSKEYHGTYSIEVLVGFSCFLSWFNLIRYLEYNKSIFTISNILKRSLPQMLLFIIGFIPIFMAYVFLGVSLFWRYEKFKDPNEATMSLFSLIMGDSIFYFLSTVNRYGLLSLIYFFSFLIVFFMAIQNIFVSIICSKANVKDDKEQNNKKKTIAKTDNSPRNSQNDLIDVTSNNTNTNSNNNTITRAPSKPALFRKQVSHENFTTIGENNWKHKTLQRMQTLSPVSNENPLLVSQTAFKRTLERRVTLNTNVQPALSEEGAFSNLMKSIPFRKYKSIKNEFKNIEMIEYEKDRILNECKFFADKILACLDSMYIDNVSDLEFYQLGLIDRVKIMKEYLKTLREMEIKVKKKIEEADIIKRKLFN